VKATIMIHNAFSMDHITAMPTVVPLKNFISSFFNSFTTVYLLVMLSFRLAVPSHDWLESIISVAARDGVNIIVGK